MRRPVAASVRAERPGAGPFGQRGGGARGPGAALARHAAVEGVRPGPAQRQPAPADALVGRGARRHPVASRRRLPGPGRDGAAAAALPAQHARHRRAHRRLGRERRHDLRRRPRLLALSHEVHDVRLQSRRVHQPGTGHRHRRRQVLLRRPSLPHVAPLHLQAQPHAHPPTLHGFRESRAILLGFTRFYRVLLGFAEIRWAFIGFKYTVSLAVIRLDFTWY